MGETVIIKIPKEIYEILKEIAQRSNKDVNELIIDGITHYLDPKDRVKLYIQLHKDYLKEAEEFYTKGDLAQAGEKYWGAITALLNAIGELRNWEHYSHADYNVIIRNLYNETRDKELIMEFGMAERLHANFYHDFMDKEFFEIHRSAVLSLISRLRKILNID